MLDENKYPLYRHKDLYEWHNIYQKQRISEQRHAQTGPYNYKYRYGSLRQGTTFFENLLKLDDVMRNSSSYPEYAVKCAARGIPEKKAVFFLLYCGVCPGRFFLFNWDDAETWERYGEDYTAWLNFKEMHKEAAKRDCSTYAEFVERAL